MSNPLEGIDGVREDVIDHAIRVRSAPGYKVFVGAMYNGRTQWVPIDTDQVADVRKALKRAARRADVESGAQR